MGMMTKRRKKSQHRGNGHLLMGVLGKMKGKKPPGGTIWTLSTDNPEGATPQDYKEIDPTFWKGQQK